MGLRAEDPAHLGLPGDRRLHVALKIEETDMTDGLAVGLLLDGPESNPDDAPEAGARHCPSPGIFAAERATHMAHHRFVSVSFGEIGNVRRTDMTKLQPLRHKGRSNWIAKDGKMKRAFHPLLLLFAERKTAEALVEARDLAAGVQHALVATGPGGMSRRVDVEVQRVAFLAPSRPGLVLGAVGHFDRDEVIIGVRPALHDQFLASGWFRPA